MSWDLIAVHWPEVRKCTACGALVQTEDSEKHIDWHTRWNKLAQEIANLAKKMRGADE